MFLGCPSVRPSVRPSVPFLWISQNSNPEVSVSVKDPIFTISSSSASALLARHEHKELDCFLFLLMNSHNKRRTAVVQHKLIGFADAELQVIVVATYSDMFCFVSLHRHALQLR